MAFVGAVCAVVEAVEGVAVGASGCGTTGDAVGIVAVAAVDAGRDGDGGARAAADGDEEGAVFVVARGFEIARMVMAMSAATTTPAMLASTTRVWFFARSRGSVSKRRAPSTTVGAPFIETTDGAGGPSF